MQENTQKVETTAKVKEQQSRVFTASLKPAWTEDQIKSFLNHNKANFECWIITHDNDYKDNGELKEPHTHILIRYDNPRKISTISKLLNVPTNFIEKVSSFKSMLRYLTHMDNPEKSPYAPFEVYTNTAYDYMALSHQDLNNKQIIDYIRNGRDMDLLDMGVPMNKITIAQRYILNQNQIHKTEDLIGKLDTLISVNQRTTRMLHTFTKDMKVLTEKTQQINQQCFELFVPLLKQMIAFTQSLESDNLSNIFNIENPSFND